MTFVVVEIDGVRYVRADEASAFAQKLLATIDLLLKQGIVLEEVTPTHPKRSPRTKTEKEAATCKLCRGEGTMRFGRGKTVEDYSCIPCQGTGWIIKRRTTKRTAASSK